MTVIRTDQKNFKKFEEETCYDEERKTKNYRTAVNDAAGGAHPERGG
jgi:hypothetical protein